MNILSTLTRTRRSGFSLIELMIVITVVALLVGLAAPSYKQYVRKSKRSEAQKLMMNHANLQEIWRSGHATYAKASEIALPVHPSYAFYIRDTGVTCAHSNPTATAYRIVACASGDQAKDKSGSMKCDRLTLDQANKKAPTKCWK